MQIFYAILKILFVLIILFQTKTEVAYTTSKMSTHLDDVRTNGVNLLAFNINSIKS